MAQVVYYAGSETTYYFRIQLLRLVEIQTLRVYANAVVIYKSYDGKISIPYLL